MKAVLVKKSDEQVETFKKLLIIEQISMFHPGEEIEIEEISGNIKDCLCKIKDKLLVLFDESGFYLVSKESSEKIVAVAELIVSDKDPVELTSIWDLLRFIVDREEFTINISNDGVATLMGDKENV